MTGEMEILSVGNELLIGKVLNTNAQWIAKMATSLAVAVKRITVVSDDVEEASSAIKEILRRAPRFVLITGGLGPTFDDKTLESIARALGRKLVVDDDALQMVKKKYQCYALKTGKSDEMTPPRVKMATIPENSKPLRNPVGTAPAVQVDLKNTVLFALPGVPAEMEAIFKESVLPLLSQDTDGVAFSEDSIFVNDIMESVLAPIIDQVMRDNPYVYIKSHPRGSEKTPHIELHLSTTANNHREAEDRIRKASAEISACVKNSNGRILNVTHIKL